MIAVGARPGGAFGKNRAAVVVAERESSGPSEFLDTVESRQWGILFGLQAGVPNIILGEGQYDGLGSRVDQGIDISIPDDEGVIQDVIESLDLDGGVIERGGKWDRLRAWL